MADVHGLYREIDRQMETAQQAREFYQQAGHRFADHYRAYAQAHAQDFDALGVEMGNVFSAIDLYTDLNAWSDTVEIVQVVEDFLDAQGYWEELVTAYHLAIESAENYSWSRGRKPEPEAWHNRIVLRLKLSGLYGRRGEYAEARRLAEDALRQARRIQHRWLQIRCLNVLSLIKTAQGYYDDANRFQAESRTLQEQIPGYDSPTDVLRHQAVFASIQGDVMQAWQLQTERLALAQEGDEQDKVADALCALGDLAVAQSDYDHAQRLYQQSLDTYRDLDRPSGIAHVLERLASLKSMQGRPDEARQLLRQQLDLVRTHGDQDTLLTALRNLADLALEH